MYLISKKKKKNKLKFVLCRCEVWTEQVWRSGGPFALEFCGALETCNLKLSASCVILDSWFPSLMLYKPHHPLLWLYSLSLLFSTSSLSTYSSITFQKASTFGYFSSQVFTPLPFLPCQFGVKTYHSDLSFWVFLSFVHSFLFQGLNIEGKG